MDWYEVGDQVYIWAQFVDSTGSAANPTTPTFAVFEEASGVPIITPTAMVAVSGSYLGLYYGVFSATGAAGFENGKHYVARMTGTVDGLTPAAIYPFRIGVFSRIVDLIADELPTGHTASGLAKLIEAAGKTAYNRLRIDRPSATLIIYDDDGVTPHKVFDLKDSSGNPTTDEPFERDPQ